MKNLNSKNTWEAKILLIRKKEKNLLATAGQLSQLSQITRPSKH